VSNQQGAINVSEEGRIKTEQLSNQQGDILSGGKLVVEGDKASTVVDNTGGRLHSNSQLDLTAKTLVNEGNISSRGNANIALKDGLNLKNAFSLTVSKNEFPYRRVALVDDVITTGSTLNEISKLLRKLGVEEIQVWGLART